MGWGNLVDASDGAGESLVRRWITSGAFPQGAARRYRRRPRGGGNLWRLSTAPGDLSTGWGELSTRRDAYGVHASVPGV